MKTISKTTSALSREKAIVCILLAFLISLPAFGKESCHQSNVISGFEADLFYRNPAEIINEIKNSSLNTIATTIAWSVVQKTDSIVDISPYTPQLDALTKAGYCLILLIDTSGRLLRNDIATRHVKNLNTLPKTSQPDWINSAIPNAFSRDFFDGLSQSMDFNNPAVVSATSNLYTLLIPELTKRYKKNIVAFSTCVTSECEIKYTQNGFKWESYSAASKNAYENYLKTNNLPAGPMPIMSYPNQLKNGNPKPEPMYPSMQAFREDSLAKFVCGLTEIVKKSKMKSIGYFGQPFSFVDGIYATGTIEKTSECFDIAAVDYNFYNGYGVEFKPDIPNFIARYASSLGFKKILVGLYMERFRNTTTGVVSEEGYRHLKESIRKISLQPDIAGFEVGNLTGSEFKRLEYLTPLLKQARRKQAFNDHKPTIGLYASMQNSYLWQGEWSNERQVLQDNLVKNFIDLINEGFDVRIISDKDFTANKSNIELPTLIVLPHLTTMPSTARAALITHIKNGGKLLIDMRLDEYLTDGHPQQDSTLRNLIGLTQVRAFSKEMRFKDNDKEITLPAQRQYIGGFLLAPTPGFVVRNPLIGGRGEGLLLQGKNTSVFGFMPLLQEGSAANWAKNLYFSEIHRLLNLQKYPQSKAVN